MNTNISQCIENALASAELKREPKKNSQRKLVLAYSGGIDSESLAHGLSVFAKHHPEFCYLLLHVHHGLSRNAEAWVEHCQQSANQYQLPIKVCRVNVAKGPRLSVEAEARKARYQAIIDNMSAGDILLTAHHEDDQLETLLLAIKRGQGPKGLASMGGVQVFDKNKYIVRPILSISRSDIEAYAAHYDLTHVEDESNQDNHYDRNFLRNVIIPQLKSRWASIATTASRSAQLCAQQQQALDEEVSKRLASMVTIWQSPLNSTNVNVLDSETIESKIVENKVLNISLLKQESEVWQALLLRAFIESKDLPMPSQVQLDEALFQLINAQNDAQVEIQLSSLLLRRYQDYCFAFNYAKDDWIAKQIQNAQIISLASQQFEQQDVIVELNTCSVHFSKVSSGIRLKLPQENESVTLGYIHQFAISGSYKCHPHFRDKKRELKKIWQELAIPVWQRSRIPLIFYKDKLVAVGQYWIEKAYIATQNEIGLTLVVNSKEQND